MLPRERKGSVFRLGYVYNVSERVSVIGEKQRGEEAPTQSELLIAGRHENSVRRANNHAKIWTAFGNEKFG